MDMKSVLVVSSDPKVVQSFGACFPAGCRVHSAPDKASAREMLAARRCDWIFIDLDDLLGTAKGPESAKAALQPFWDLYPSIVVVVMTSPERIREAVVAVKAGAADFLTYPIRSEEVRYVTDGIHQAIILKS